MPSQECIQHFLDAISSKIDDDDFTDATITCQGTSFSTHLLIVATHSEVLTNALSNGMEESIDKSIDLSHDGLPLIKRLYSYFYTLDYDGAWNPNSDTWTAVILDPPNDVATSESTSSITKRLDVNGEIWNEPTPSVQEMSTTLVSPEKIVAHDSFDDFSTSPKSKGKKKSQMKKSAHRRMLDSEEISAARRDIPLLDSSRFRPDGSLLLNARMYALADKYSIMQLKTLAMEKFNSIISTYVAQGTSKETGKERMPSRSDEIMVQEFADATHEIYSSTLPRDRGLRDIISKVLDNFRLLRPIDSFQELLQEVPEFCADVVNLMSTTYMN